MANATTSLKNIANNEHLRLGFEELTATMHDIALEKQWWNPPKSFGEQIVMMHSELSEAIEAYRDEFSDANNIWFQNDGKPEGVPIELADLVIRVMDTCGRYNINLWDAIITKATYNLKRPSRHGNKKL